MMRRKSTRTAAKSSPEKAKKPESPVRKSRRQSKRRKKVTTSESSDESPDELLSQVACDSKSATKTEEPVWKVTSSASPSGEVQKLKISLTRPANAEPTVTKRETRRSRSSAVVSDTDSDHFSGRAKGSNEESTDREDATNKDVDIKGKGKSKDKHKHQKSSQFSEEGIEKTCEISANIQVTTESPSIIDRVDDENLNTEMKKDISNANDDMSEKTSQEVKSEENQEEPEAVKDIANEAEDQIAQENKTEAENEQSNETDCAKVINPEEASETPHKETDEMHEEQKANLVETPCLGNEDVEKCESSSTVEEVSTTVESVVQSEPEQSQEIPNEVEKEEALPVVSAEDTAVIRDAEETNDEINSGHEEENTVEIKSQREEESTAEIKSGHEMDEPTPKGQEDTEVQDSQPETSVERMDLDMSESEYLTNIQQQICTVESTQQPKPEREKSPIQKRTQRKFILKHPNSVQTEVVVERKKSWGKLIKSLSDKQLPSINLKDIQNMCSDIVFPSENEVKFLTSLTEKKRRLLSESRKVSTEEPEKSTDYTTQTSVNSTSSTDGLKLEEEANIIAMNRKISIVDDSVSKLKPPPSPAKNPVSAVLFITNLVRPFTLKQLKELLERTGKIKEDGFWTDRIKSKCYVHYETTEEAEATRNALHGVQWPIGNGKKLIIDYATPQDLEDAKNPPPPPAKPTEDAKMPDKEIEETSANYAIEEKTDKEKRRREEHVREWDLGKAKEMSRTRSRSRDRHERKRHLKRTPSPHDDFVSKKHQKVEEPVPQKLMDDLFQKTKTMPSIYWQPLSPEEIATKQQQRLMRMAEHKRRIEETSRNRAQDFPRGSSYRRRYD